jgi:hypothetical protein
MDADRGWGGPIAIVVAVVVMYLIHVATVKIHNHSPTEDDEYEWGEEDQVDDDFEIETRGTGGGVVDLDGIERHEWGSISKD